MTSSAQVIACSGRSSGRTPAPAPITQRERAEQPDAGSARRRSQAAHRSGTFAAADAQASAVADIRHDQLDDLRRELRPPSRPCPARPSSVLRARRVPPATDRRTRRRALSSVLRASTCAPPCWRGRSAMFSRPQLDHRLLQSGDELLPEGLAHHRHVLPDELVVLVGVTCTPESHSLALTHAFIGADQPVERALRQRQRHVRPGGGVGDAAEEVDAPVMPAPPGLRIFMPLRSASELSGLLGAVPVLEAEIEPRAEHMRRAACCSISALTNCAPACRRSPCAITSIGWP